jgi:hypothetical protein
MNENPLVIVLYVGVAMYVGKMYWGDFLAAKAGKPNASALPGAVAASLGAFVIGTLGALFLLGVETGGEIALDVVDEQSDMVWFFVFALGSVWKLPLSWFEARCCLRKAAEAERHGCRNASANAASRHLDQIVLRQTQNTTELRCSCMNGFQPISTRAALFTRILRIASFAGISRHSLVGDIIRLIGQLPPRLTEAHLIEIVRKGDAQCLMEEP